MAFTRNQLDEYKQFVDLKRGQILPETDLGMVISQLARNDDLKVFMEIGTWNGHGSTACFKRGFDQRRTPFEFYGLEVNHAIFGETYNLYKEVPGMNIICASLGIEPNVVEGNDYSLVDKYNFDMVGYFPLYKHKVDVMLFDGSVFCTFGEIQYVLNHHSSFLKYILLDDVNLAKNDRSFELLNADDSKFKLVMKSEERNGTAVFERKGLNAFNFRK